MSMLMQRWFSSLVAPVVAFGLVACHADGEYSSALPSSSEVTLTVPSSAGTRSQSGDGIGTTTAALLGATSELYQITWGVSATVNTATVGLVDLLRLVTLFPSTTATINSRTWGPHTPGGLDPLTYRLVVVKLADGHFSYSLDARLRASTSATDFVSFIDGDVTRARIGQGHGTMTLHFDNRRRLLPDSCEDGLITAAFSNDTAAGFTNYVTLSAFANANPRNLLCHTDKAVDETYHFAQDQAGRGNFRFVVDADFNQPGENKPAKEHLDVQSIWTASGAGRSSVTVTGGDVAIDLAAASLSTTLVATQCWGTSFQTVYQTSSPLDIMATQGSLGDCISTPY